VAVLLGMYLLLRSRLGLGLTAIRDSQAAAGSLGVEVDRSKRVVFIVAALGCGAAGALVLANSLRVQPDSAFGVQWTAYMVFCVIIGGLGTVEGPLIGAVIFFLLQDRLAGYGASYLILLGAVAVVMTVTVPHGIWGLITSATPLRLFPISHRLRWTGRSEMAP